MVYDKEFLIDAFLWRYSDILLNNTKEDLEKYVTMVRNFADKVSKDDFRKWCSLDAAEIQKFRLATGR